MGSIRFWAQVFIKVSETLCHGVAVHVVEISSFPWVHKILDRLSVPQTHSQFSRKRACKELYLRIKLFLITGCLLLLLPLLEKQRGLLTKYPFKDLLRETGVFWFTVTIIKHKIAISHARSLYSITVCPFFSDMTQLKYICDNQQVLKTFGISYVTLHFFKNYRTLLWKHQK